MVKIRRVEEFTRRVLRIQKVLQVDAELDEAPPQGRGRVDDERRTRALPERQRTDTDEVESQADRAGEGVVCEPPGKLPKENRVRAGDNVRNVRDERLRSDKRRVGVSEGCRLVYPPACQSRRGNDSLPDGACAKAQDT